MVTPPSVFPYVESKAREGREAREEKKRKKAH
jgi:hypothetical protein